ncbi:MAG: hypothetical protein K5778_07325 [Bacteroidaceae bacterium]|nr:hypothetical protein [Bacteroidaceae bacterium]
MKRKYPTRHIILLSIILLSSTKGKAQQTYDWSGNEVSAVSGQADLYLYNVGAQQWLNASGAWGSQPSLYPVGMPLTITQNGSGYTIQGDVKNPYFADYLTVQSDGTWFDQNLKDGSRWSFTPITGSSTTYTLSATADGTTYFLLWNGNNRVLAWSNSTTQATAAANPNAQWKVVSRTDRETAMQDASPSRPLDVTFYIKDQNFVFNGKQRSAWVWSNPNANHSIGINGNDENAASDAQYYNGEVFNDANTISQTLTGLKRGTYILSAQAFYRNGNIPTAEAARQNGTESINAFLFAGAAETPLLSIFDDAGNYGDNVGYASALGYIPDTRTQSGQYFYKGLYNRNNIAFYVSTPGSSINIGLRKEAGTQDWMAFDNFHLTYFGEDDTADYLNGLYNAYDLWNPADFLLDEDSTTFDNLTAYSHQRLLMRRSLDLGKWNSIILPVSIGYEQFTYTFGQETRLAKLIGLDSNNPDRVIFQRITPQAGQLALQAGTHYLIYPTRQPDVATGETYRRSDGTTLTGPLYIVENISMEPGQFIVDSLYATSDFTQGLYMMGTYYKRDGTTAHNEKIPAGSYAFARGDLYHIATPQTLKAFRCWMEDMSPSSQAKAYHISVVDEVPTGIEAEQGTKKEVRTTMYDLQGRPVKSDAPLLPGLYIIGNKKVIIR